MTRPALLLAALLALAACEDEAPYTSEEDTPVMTTEPMEAEPMTGGTAHRGDLSDGDSTLASGEFADEVRVTARRGQRIVVDLSSEEDLDTYVILRSPAGVQRENDDAGDNTHSRVSVVADTSGTWRAIATSYEAGQTGPYTLRISVE